MTEPQFDIEDPQFVHDGDDSDLTALDRAQLAVHAECHALFRGLSCKMQHVFDGKLEGLSGLEIALLGRVLDRFGTNGDILQRHVPAADLERVPAFGITASGKRVDNMG